ncbi:MAG TPA: 30S ribosomal protein S6 [Ignavibacteria bacterium]
MKKNYESYIIFDGNLEDSNIEEFISKYENLLKKNEVDIKNIDRIGRRRLAYAIKKKLNGYYVCFEISSSPDFIAKLERAFKLDENVLRYLNIHIDKKTTLEKDDYLKKKAMIAEKLEEEKRDLAKTETVTEQAAVENQDNKESVKL